MWVPPRWAKFWLADAETVNERLEPGFGADWVKHLIHVDEQQPVVVMLIGFFQPFESEISVSLRGRVRCDVVGSSGAPVEVRSSSFGQVKPDLWREIFLSSAAISRILRCSPHNERTCARPPDPMP